jgi:hypothetical protein
LAKAELTVKPSRSVSAPPCFGAAGVFGVYAFGALTAAIWLSIIPCSSPSGRAGSSFSCSCGAPSTSVVRIWPARCQGPLLDGRGE